MRKINRMESEKYCGNKKSILKTIFAILKFKLAVAIKPKVLGTQFLISLFLFLVLILVVSAKDVVIDSGTLIVDEDKLIVTSLGNVGIGTAVPSERLHVIGNILADGIICDINGCIAGGAGSSGWTDDGTNVRLTTSTDNVGIGTLTPAGKLDVDGKICIKGDCINNWAEVKSGIGKSGWVDDGLVVRLTKSTDRVGIGTTTPRGILDVDLNPGGNGHVRLTISDNLPGDPYNVGASLQDDARIIMSMEEATHHQALVFGDVWPGELTKTMFGIARSNDAGATWQPSFVVQQGGNIGIGTNDPKAELDVVAFDGIATIRLAEETASPNVWEIRADQNLPTLPTSRDSLGFWSPEGGGGYRLVIEGDGNVGIGTVSPTTKLHVVGPGIGGPTFRMVGDSMTVEDSSPEIVFVDTNDDSYWTILGQNGAFYFQQTANNGISWTRKITFNKDGNVGIGTDSPNVALDVIGSIEYTGTITDVSDDRLKENVVTVNNALDKIQSINGVYFNMIDIPEQTEIGFIAQNIQEVMPEAVSVVDFEQGYLGVSYQSIIPVLVEAIKEQQNEIEELKQRLEALESKT